MILSGMREVALANRRRLSLPNGTTYWKSEFLRSSEGDRPAPQAFLIEQDAGTVIRPHFHKQNQFQVVVGGDGLLGRHRVAPLSVHYAARYTGYGPIEAGETGLHYFSLRPVTTALAYYLPESRDQMLDLPRRHLLGETVALSDDPVLRARHDVQVDPVMAPQPDGIAAWLMRVPAGAAAPAPRASGDAERFYLVCRGALEREGALLESPAVLFATGGERDFTATGGPHGLELLVLQFPLAAADAAPV